MSPRAPHSKMLRRFSLYGFLKNQRYFEPFLVLALVEAGATFLQIGLLVAIREGVHHVLEIPSGALADGWGRRRTMVLAFVAYPLALLGFVLVPGFVGWAAAMALIGVGDALRSGTHKAMIFDWLEQQGRADDNTRTYGITRSWSQVGSAVSIPIAAGLVILSDAYVLVFWATGVPWLLNLLNLATYPRALEGPGRDGDGPGPWAVLRRAIRTVGRSASLRRLVGEAMVFQGIYKATKDFVQPALAVLAVALALDGKADTALVVGVAYIVIHALGALASRTAAPLSRRVGGAARASGFVWVGLTACLAATALAAGAVPALAVVGFAGVAIVYNVYRPLLISRVDAASDRGMKATVLSVESQATTLAAIVLAPAAGLVADLAASRPGAFDGLWAVAAVALGLALPIGLLSLFRHKE